MMTFKYILDELHRDMSDRFQDLFLLDTRLGDQSIPRYKQQGERDYGRRTDFNPK